MRLKNKKALITGASKGIGKSIAVGFTEVLPIVKIKIYLYRYFSPQKIPIL